MSNGNNGPCGASVLCIYVVGFIVIDLAFKAGFENKAIAAYNKPYNEADTELFASSCSAFFPVQPSDTSNPDYLCSSNVSAAVSQCLLSTAAVCLDFCTNFNSTLSGLDCPPPGADTSMAGAQAFGLTCAIFIGAPILTYLGFLFCKCAFGSKVRAYHEDFSDVAAYAALLATLPNQHAETEALSCASSQT